MMMFIPYPIRAKYYPWALIGFFTVINGFQLQFDAFIGIVYGYLYFYYLSSYLVIPDRFLLKADECFPFKYLKRFKGYIIMGGANSAFTVFNNQQNRQPAATTNTSTVNNSQSTQVVIQPPANQQPPTGIAFKGKGTVVGGGTNTTNSTTAVTVTTTETPKDPKKKSNNNYQQLQEEDV